ncbi:DUF1932 domain-containing protein [Streptomyces sp. NBC_00056]|uniref:DUF1932 domain-containing protein n=1 Tax=Streptomyces sp. NBC_00056 TaxID=2975633 RepID=UPI003245A718
MSYSSYQKASRALAAVAYALASDHGVEAELLDIAEGRTTSYLAETAYFPKAAARAWRWGPEMKEAAHALEKAGLPSDLADAAATVMGRGQGSRRRRRISRSYWRSYTRARTGRRPRGSRSDHWAAVSQVVSWMDVALR